jgi:23S rRNA (cytosine1962-C5)-methyltransferase
MPDTTIPMSSKNDLTRWFPDGWRDHELLDSGDGSRLERFGDLVLIRPEPKAIWARGLAEADWSRMAAAQFVPTGRTKGHWDIRQSVPDSWEICFPISPKQNLHFSLELTRFKHVGIFPEQAANWRWIADRMSPEKRMLNLFAYRRCLSRGTVHRCRCDPCRRHQASGHLDQNEHGTLGIRRDTLVC